MVLLATPPTVTPTTAEPDCTPAGETAVIAVLLQVDHEKDEPFTVNSLVLSGLPKLFPAIVTVPPGAAGFGDRLVIVGAPTTVKVSVLLVTPFAVTPTE
jgi:hypothetical protein